MPVGVRNSAALLTFKFRSARRVETDDTAEATERGRFEAPEGECDLAAPQTLELCSVQRNGNDGAAEGVARQRAIKDCSNHGRK